MSSPSSNLSTTPQGLIMVRKPGVRRLGKKTPSAKIPLKKGKARQ